MLPHALRRVSAGPIQIVLAAVLCLPLLAFGSLPGSSAPSGAAVAGGTVTGPSGAAMPGATVDLYAWPSDAVQKALKPGKLVPTTLLATATTNNTGKYMLRVPVARLKAAAVSSGYANLEVFSPVGGKKRPPSCGKDPHGHELAFTGFFLERHRPPAWAVVGQGYIVQSRKTAGDSVNFNYNRGASHNQSSSLGVGISGYGFDAGYNGSGTHSSTATRTEGYAPSRGNAWFRTMFSTGQFRGICYGDPRDSSVPYQKQHGKCPHTITDKQGVIHYVHKCFWLIHSTGWLGGQSIVHPRHPLAQQHASACTTTLGTLSRAISGPLCSGQAGGTWGQHSASRART